MMSYANVAAIIYVDGEEFIQCEVGEDFNHFFKETVEQVGGEVALMVWKPRLGYYIRAKLNYSASKDLH